MIFDLLIWVFVLAVALHNLEEAIWLPAWSHTAGRWHHPVGAYEFRFALVILTLLAVIAAGLARIQGPGSFGAYLVSGYALAMLLNVAVPHLIATIALRTYAPGTATALLLNLPATVLLLRAGLTERQIERGTFIYAGPVTVLAIAASIPLLFAIGRRVGGPR